MPLSIICPYFWLLRHSTFLFPCPSNATGVAGRMRVASPFLLSHMSQHTLRNLGGFGQKSEIILKVRKGSSHRDSGESFGNEQKFRLAMELAVNMLNLQSEFQVTPRPALSSYKKPERFS